MVCWTPDRALKFFNVSVSIRCVGTVTDLTVRFEIDTRRRRTLMMQAVQAAAQRPFIANVKAVNVPLFVFKRVL